MCDQALPIELKQLILSSCDYRNRCVSTEWQMIIDGVESTRGYVVVPQTFIKYYWDNLESFKHGTGGRLFSVFASGSQQVYIYYNKFGPNYGYGSYCPTTSQVRCGSVKTIVELKNVDNELFQENPIFTPGVGIIEAYVKMHPLKDDPNFNGPKILEGTLVYYKHLLCDKYKQAPQHVDRLYAQKDFFT